MNISGLVISIAQKNPKITQISSPLKCSHLSCQKCLKGFHHQSLRWSLQIHVKPTEKTECDIRIIAVHKQCLKAWSVSSTKRKMSDRELPENACWQDKVETRLHVRGKGVDFGLYFAACGGLCITLEFHPRQSCNTPTRNRSCSLYFSRVIIYVPAMNFHSSSLCTKTSHISPKNQMEQGWVTAKSIRLLRFSCSWVMDSPYAVQNYTCESKSWGLFVRSSMRINTAILL